MKKLIINNVVSGLSLLILVIFGTQYLIFKNTEPYQNLIMAIINNPVSGNEIHFAMVGHKMLSCTVDNVYAVATNRDGDEVVLNEFLNLYYRNTEVGENVTNSWVIKRHPDIVPGIWRVSVFGDWKCTQWIFSETKTRSYDNILLVVNDN